MKALLLTDVHEDKSVLEWVEKTKFDVDAIIVGGDIALWGRQQFYRRFYSRLSELGYTVFYVPGNQDPNFKWDLKSLTNLHGRSETFKGFILAGIGGSNHTPFNTPFELDDEEAQTLLEKLPERIDILISHCPPKLSLCDRTKSGEHIGSSPVREFVLKRQPRLVFSGHVHESRGIDRLGESVIVNPGAALSGFYANLALEEKVEVRLLEMKM